MSNIRFLKRNEIEPARWDALINHSVQQLPYALSWYLDAIAENWGALVAGDYTAALPLVWMRKLGVKYLYQPYYCQQLGFFSSKEISKKLMLELIAEAGKRFPFGEVQLNPSAETVKDELSLIPKKNLLLDLSGSYADLKKKYSDNHRRNISKGERAGLQFTTAVEMETFQQFYLQQIDRKKERFEAKHEKIFKRLTQAMMAQQQGRLYAVIDKDGNICSAAMFVIHQKRVINVMNISSPVAKSTGAAHFMFDGVIRLLEGKGMLLDFEGSSVPGIARFYEGFGAYEQPFYLYKHHIIKTVAKWF